MPKIKSAKKRVLVAQKKRLINNARKSSLKTAAKKVIDALASADLEMAKKLFADAEVAFARAKGKGVIHKNAASRKISRLCQKIKNVEQLKA